MIDLLRSRIDLIIAFRVAQTLPLRGSHLEVGVHPPAGVEIAEFVFGLIPVVSMAIAFYESHTGRDLFGYKLTSTARVVLAAGAILPALAQFAAAGRAWYRAERLAALDGNDDSKWRSLTNVARCASQQPMAVTKLRLAERQLIADRGLLKGRAEAGALSTLERLFASTTSAASRPSSAAADLFNTSVKKHPCPSELDDLTTARGIDKGRQALAKRVTSKTPTAAKRSTGMEPRWSRRQTSGQEFPIRSGSRRIDVVVDGPPNRSGLVMQETRSRHRIHGRQ